MALKNKRADTSSNIVTWVGTILVMLIIGLWIIKNIFPYYQLQETIDIDAKNIYVLTSDSCSSEYYSRLYNPFLSEGSLDINNSILCIRARKLQRCYYMLCDTGLTEKNMSITQSTLFLNITRDETGTYTFRMIE